MNNLNIKLNGAKFINPTIEIDDKVVKCKKNEFGNLVANYQTTKNKVNVKILKSLAINSPIWWLSEIFFFIMSLFGIFDSRADKKCQVVSCEFDIDLIDKTQLTIGFNNYKDHDRAVEIECNSSVKEVKNIYYTDNIAKKRIKTIKIIKMVVWLMLIVTAIILATIYLV